MSHARVYAAVSPHVECFHVEPPDDPHRKAPFACYLLDYDRPVAAGDEQIAVKRRWIVELYEKARDRALESALADSLRAEFGPVRRDEQWIENDNLLMVVYTFYEIEGKEGFDG